MKVLHVIPNLNIGGAERIVQDICLEIKNNNDIKLITFDNTISKLNSKHSFHIHIPSYFKPSITSNSILKIDEIKKFISEYKPDIIHSHLWASEILLTQIEIGKAKRLSHFHDNMTQLNKCNLPKTKLDITNRYERWIYLKENKNHFICISKDTFNYAKKILPKKLHSNITLIPNAINYNKFNSNSEKELETIRLINIGSFVPKKNQKFAIDILIEILNKKIITQLTFLGDGNMIEQVKTYAKQKGVSKYINFMGNVDDVPAKLKNANIYLHTAYYEPFGLVILEAMASNLPVVSLDGIGNRDIINNEENGYIIKEQNAEVFANIIIELFRNNKLYNKISNAGNNTAKRHDIKEYVNKLLEIYKASISSTNRQ